jgi:hypothetical protein
MTWAPSQAAAMARLINNAVLSKRTLRPGVGGASLDPCFCKGLGQPNGFSSGCAGLEQFKVRQRHFIILIIVVIVIINHLYA